MKKRKRWNVFSFVTVKLKRFIAKNAVSRSDKNAAVNDMIRAAEQ